MQLINFAFTASRQNQLVALRDSFSSSSRIRAATRLNHSLVDTAAISQAGKIKSEILTKQTYMQNLLCARNYLKFQKPGSQEISSIYQRMEELSSESLPQAKNFPNSSSNEF